MVLDKRNEPMVQNTAVQNALLPSDIVGLKRKMDDVSVDWLEGDEKENEGRDKKQMIKVQPVVDLKSRKVLFKQPPIHRNYPRKKLLKFEMFLVDLQESGKMVQESLPEEYWDLIAMAGHERWALAVVNVDKGALGMPAEVVNCLSDNVLSHMAGQLFSFCQYGFVPTDFNFINKIPVALQIRRWEVKNLERWFPSDQQETLRMRRLEREKARQDCLEILNGLDDAEKYQLVTGKEAKEKIKDVEPEVAQIPSKPTLAHLNEDPDDVSADADSSPVKLGRTPEEIEAVRLKKHEKDEKRAVLAEKKAVKEREAKKKEEALSKQAKTMSMFFKKPSLRPSNIAGPSNSTSSSDVPETMSDYRKTFKTMPSRANVKIAKVNPLLHKKSSEEEVISGRKVKEWQRRGAPDVQEWSSQDFIVDHLRKHGHQLRQPRAHFPRGLKTAPISGSVGEFWLALQEAEEPREVLNHFRDRNRFPWKTLAFDQQPRPPYSGTFTKKSLVVGPRTPFARDPIFDYSYDSGDEWQDDENGEDVDDFGASKEDEEDDESEAEEGEFDDWLDDSEDLEVTHSTELDLEDPLRGDSLPLKVIKKEKDVPVKTFVKLVPTWKGPVWENRVGEEGTEGLETYRIQLLNETPDSIDPFTYKSIEPMQQFKTSYSTAIIGSNLNVKCLLATEVMSNKTHQRPLEPSTQKTTDHTASPQPLSSKSDRRGRKATSFPPSHLAELFHLVDGDTRYQKELIAFLRAKFDAVTTKAAIEHELKECAMRERVREGKWRVYREAYAAAGLEPPPSAPPKAGTLGVSVEESARPTQTSQSKLQPLETKPPVLDTGGSEPIII
ncbi:hypothetical protein L204_100901 [Cryptococcus depauperatus]